MTNLLPVLRDEIIAASDVSGLQNSLQEKNKILQIQMGKGGLSEEEVQDLREWTFELDVEEEDLLTRYGLAKLRTQKIDFFYKPPLVLDIQRG